MRLLSFTFDSRCNFSFKKCLFKFEGRELAFHVGDDKYCEVIQTFAEDNEDEDLIFKQINKFLFCFAYENYCSFHYRGSCARGWNQTIDLLEIPPFYREQRIYRNFSVDFTHVKEASSNELEIALSLYNEAMYTYNQFYKFICLWKILEINYSGRTKKAEEWINEVIASNQNILIEDFIKELINKNKDVGKTLKENYRNAIYHIERPPKIYNFVRKNFIEVNKAYRAIDPFVKFFIKNELKLPIHATRLEIIKIES